MSTELDPSNTVYSGLVQVLLNYGKTENVSGELADPERVSGRKEFVCLLDTDTISIEFSALLNDQRVDINR